MNMEMKQSMLTQMAMSSTEQASMKAFVDLTDEDVRVLKELAPLIAMHADEIVEGFYANVARYQSLLDVIRGAGSTIERLKSAQKQYLLELFGGD